MPVTVTASATSHDYHPEIQQLQHNSRFLKFVEVSSGTALSCQLPVPKKKQA